MEAVEAMIARRKPANAGGKTHSDGSGSGGDGATSAASAASTMSSPISGKSRRIAEQGSQVGRQRRRGCICGDCSDCGYPSDDDDDGAKYESASKAEGDDKVCNIRSCTHP